jgi:hypothetical protein
MSAPIFARRHYCAIAGVIRDAGYLDSGTGDRLVSEFCDLFDSDNARFSPARFRAACEPVASCTTCGRPAHDGYVNERAGERCVDAIHDMGRRAA